VRVGALSALLCAAAVVGHAVLHRFDFRSVPERVVFTVGAGLGLFGELLFLLGLAGVLFPAVVVGITGLFLLIGAAWFLRSAIGQFQLGRRSERQPESGKRSRMRTVLIAVGILMGLAFVGFLALPAFYPPIHWDATSNHLVLARDYLREHRIVVDYGVPQPILPCLNHLLFSWAMAISDDIAAQLLEFSLSILVAVTIFAWSRRVQRKMWGSAAALFWLANSIVLWLSHSCYVDIGVTALALLGVYSLRVFGGSGEHRWWYLGMLLLSFSAGAKQPGLFFVAAGAVIGIWARVRSKLTTRQLLIGWSIAAIIVVPWYGFIGYHTGNPLWPVLSRFSRGDWGNPAVAGFLSWINDVGLRKTPLNFLLLPYHLIFNKAQFLPESGISRLLLLWPIAWALSFRDRDVRWWTSWALGFTALWFLSSQQLRLLLPAIPFMILAMFESLEILARALVRRQRVLRALWATAAACALLLAVRAERLVSITITPPIDAEQREKFLSNYYRGYRAARYINGRITPDTGRSSTYVISGSWLNYYFANHAVDVAGLVQRGNRPAADWPTDREWVASIESRGVQWIVFVHFDAPRWYKKSDNPAWRPYWPPYKIVYEDADAWVYSLPPGERAATSRD